MHLHSRTLLGAAVLAIVGTFVLQPPSYAAKSTIGASTTKPIVKETFTLSGKLSKKGARTVTLQYKKGSTWTKVKTTRSSSSGSYKFWTSVPEDINREFRAVAHGSTTPARMIYPQAQTVRVSFDKAPIGQSMDTTQQSLTHGTITFEPGRKDRTVSVEREDGSGGWVKVASGRQGSTGQFGFWAKLSNGTTYRATATKSKGAPWVGSNPSVYASFPLKLNEGFTTSGIDADPDYWSDRQTGTRLAHTRKVSMSHPNATSVVDGKLQVRVQKGRDEYKNFNAYTKKEWADHTLKYINGHVSTENKFSFTYGFAAARVKFATNRGQHGSFWLQHPSGVPGDEIDTVEFFGKGYVKSGIKGGLSHYIHTPWGSGTKKIGDVVDSRKWFASGKTPYNSYHVYSVEWTPKSYVFRLDGHVVRTISRTTSTQEQFIVISQLTSDWELEEVFRTGRSSLRKALESEIAAGGSKTYVDWVKVWVDPKGTYSDASKGISKQKP